MALSLWLLPPLPQLPLLLLLLLLLPQLVLVVVDDDDDGDDEPLATSMLRLRPVPESL